MHFEYISGALCQVSDVLPQFQIFLDFFGMIDIVPAFVLSHLFPLSTPVPSSPSLLSKMSHPLARVYVRSVKDNPVPPLLKITCRHVCMQMEPRSIFANSAPCSSYVSEEQKPIENRERGVKKKKRLSPNQQFHAALSRLGHC